STPAPRSRSCASRCRTWNRETRICHRGTEAETEVVRLRLRASVPLWPDPSLSGYDAGVLITISGTPGSGKSTVARLLEKRLALPYVYAGDIFRREAQRRGISLPQLNFLAETDHSIDRQLDDAMLEYARKGNVILEGRLAGFFARQEKIPALKVYL